MRLKLKGYEKQNEELVELGFSTLSRNLKYLILHDGNVKKIVEALEEKMKQKEE